MVNGFYTIDAHCHIYPEKIASKAVAGTDAFYGTVAKGKGTVPDLLEMGKNAGVDHFVVHSVATTPKQVSSINNFIAQSVLDADGKFTGLGTLHPDSENIDRDFNEILNLNLNGVKLHPDIQRFALDDPKCMRMYELCQEYKLPMLIHTGDNRYDFSNPNRMEPVLKQFPNLVVVGAHLGGFSVWQEAGEKLSKYENFYVDCTSTIPFANKEIALDTMKKFTTDKVLFGTDYPMWDEQTELDTFFSLGFDKTDLEKMLSENAKKIFNIK